MNNTEKKLLVPISLEVLLVNKDHNTQLFADRTYNYQSLESGEVLGDSMIKDYFATDKAMEKGAHIHWSLPDALTQGFQTNSVDPKAFKDISGLDAEKSIQIFNELQRNQFINQLNDITPRFVPGESEFSLALSKEFSEYEQAVIEVLQKIVNKGDIEYLAVPVCWYVLRIFTDYSDLKNPSTKFKAWVVESTHFTDKYDEGVDRITIPVKDATSDTFDCLFLGRKSDYKTWLPDIKENYLEKLTAVAPGDPMFAAYYPSCKSVFGFHDSLDDISSGNITYLVLGWYPDQELDPLNGEVSDELWYSCMSQLNWSVADKVTDTPQQILCHGMVYNVAWCGDNGNYKTGIPEATPEIVWGNNSIEAISTLIASKLSNETKDIAKILEAFNYELLSELDYPDGIAKLEEKMHEKTFSSLPGGAQYTISYPSSNENQEAPDAIEQFPGTIGTDLAEINLAQRQLEDIEAKLASWQWEVYATWYKYISDRGGPSIDSETPDFQKIIDDLEGKINNCRTQRNQLQLKINALYEKINGDLKVSLPEYTLNIINRDRFWEPNDPVLLFSGEGVSRSFRYGYDGQFSEDGTLNCRVTDDTLVGLTIPIKDVTVTITEKELLAFGDKIPNDKTPVPQELKSLIVETMLLDTNQAKLIAIAALKLSGTVSPTVQDIEALAVDISKIQTLIWNACLVKKVSAQQLAEAGGLVGTVPNKISVKLWSQAWVPLYMEWFVNILEYEDVNPDFSNILSHWHLGDIDYSCLSASPGNKAHQVKGAVVITPHAPYNFQNALKNYIDKLEPDFPEIQELRDICEQLGKLDILSQTMSGFNNSQIMRKETLQFPVFDIPKAYGGDPEFAKKVAGLTEDMNKLAPSPESFFNPIRGSFMKLMKLWLVDAFGQIKEIADNNHNLISEELTTLGDNFKDYVTLKPAFAQPARLNLDWISADESRVTNSDPASSPVCGWLLPNHLDNSLMIFDQAGKQLGQMRVFYKSDKTSFIQWESSPGENIRPENISNLQLKEFVEGLLNFNVNSGEALTELLMNIDETLWSIDPLGFKDDQSLSVLTGRPLALVNASLGLEIQGLPAFNQSWRDLGKFNSYGFEKVQFPARLGDISQICDGLLGYFIKNGKDTYKTFHATSGIKKKEIESGYITYDHTINIHAAQAYDQIKLSFIVDPRVGVHITTGILPVKYKEISSGYISGALNNMDVTFSIAPLLSTMSKLTIPLPAVDSTHQWSWVYHPDTISWSEVTDLGNVSSNANFRPEPKEMSEGWLKLIKKEKK
jgi:hypothetical protein